MFPDQHVKSSDIRAEEISLLSESEDFTASEDDENDKSDDS